jgi:hypothetical protein
MSIQQICSFSSTAASCQPLDYYGKDSIIQNLESCDSNIQEYLINHGISGSADGGSHISETGLILNRAGKFDILPEERNGLFICTYHRQYLSTRWSGCKRTTCTYPEHQGKRASLKQHRRVTQKLSESIFSATGYIVPIGSGIIY